MEIPKKYKKFIEEKEFPGFPSEPTNNYWRYPRIVNGWWHKLSGSEQKVLDYILRHTWGYDKDQDAISYTQFRDGVFSKREKKCIDKGTGLPYRSIARAIKGLVKKRFILTVRKPGKTTVYQLRTTAKKIEQ